MPSASLDRNSSVLRYVLEHRAMQDADGTCVILPDFTRWSWAQAVDAACRAANALRARGVQRGELVLVMLPNGADFLRAWWGIGFLGAVLVPVNVAYRGEMLRHLCVDSGARLVVTGGEAAARIAELGIDLEILDAAALEDAGTGAPVLDSPIEPWDLASVIYTSGTTGAAKGVLSTHQMAYVGALGSIGPPMQPEDLVLADLPLFHVGGQLPALGAWSAGRPVALRERFAGPQYFDLVRRVGATRAVLLGTMAAYLESQPAAPADADNPLRFLICAPMPADPKAFMRRFGIEEIASCYGMSESPLVTKATWRIDDDRPRDPRTIGRPREGLELRLVDENDVEVPLGRPGEAILRTATPWELAPGYLGRPDASLKLWRNGWLHTGDMLVRDENGDHFFVDRVTDSLRRRGENISSFHVEIEVLAHPDVAEAACVAARGELGDDEVKVFVVPRSGVALDLVALTHFLVARMPHFAVPRYFEILDALPKTATQKVQKHLLRERGNTSATWDREADGGITVRR